MFLFSFSSKKQRFFRAFTAQSRRWLVRVSCNCHCHSTKSSYLYEASKERIQHRHATLLWVKHQSKARFLYLGIFYSLLLTLKYNVFAVLLSLYLPRIEYHRTRPLFCTFYLLITHFNSTAQSLFSLFVYLLLSLTLQHKVTSLFRAIYHSLSLLIQYTATSLFPSIYLLLLVPPSPAADYPSKSEK